MFTIETGNHSLCSPLTVLFEKFPMLGIVSFSLYWMAGQNTATLAICFPCLSVQLWWVFWCQPVAAVCRTRASVTRGHF